MNICFANANENASTPLGQNIAFFRNNYYIDIMKSKNINHCLSVICAPTLSNEQTVLINQLETLLSVKYGSHHINGFTRHDIDEYIKHLVTS